MGEIKIFESDDFGTIKTADDGKEHVINNPDGSIRVTKTPKVTGKGQRYFVNKFLGNKEEM